MGSPNRFSSLLASSTMIFVIVALFLVAAAVAEPVAEASADPGYHGYGYGHHGYGHHGYGHHGYHGYGHHGFYGHHHGKREAEAAPEADADAYYGHLGYAHHGWSSGIRSPRIRRLRSLCSRLWLLWISPCRFLCPCCWISSYPQEGSRCCSWIRILRSPRLRSRIRIWLSWLKIYQV